MMWWRIGHRHLGDKLGLGSYCLCRLAQDGMSPLPLFRWRANRSWIGSVALQETRLVDIQKHFLAPSNFNSKIIQMLSTCECNRILQIPQTSVATTSMLLMDYYRWLATKGSVPFFVASGQILCEQALWPLVNLQRMIKLRGCCWSYHTSRSALWRILPRAWWAVLLRPLCAVLWMS
jgi:hypothetical protein